jgi:hypothetical protein
MIPGFLSLRAGEAAARYDFLTQALSAIYARSLISRNVGTAAGVRTMMTEARNIASSYLATELDRIDADLEEVAQHAQGATIKALTSNESFELTVSALEHLRASGDYLRDELLAQISRDIATLRKTIQKANLQIDLATRLQAVNPRRQGTQNAPAIDFTFHDRASRKWSSRTFVRTTWRHTLLSVYNETVLLTLADHGIQEAVIEHEDPAAPHHGKILSIVQSDEHDTYQDLRDEIFHPNAHAILKARHV